jgi:hypothetical protein
MLSMQIGKRLTRLALKNLFGAMLLLMAAQVFNVGVASAQTSGRLAAAVPFDQQTAVIAKGSLTSVPVVLDPSASGGDIIDISAGDPATVVTLITPGNASINAQNAAASGVTWASSTWALGAFTYPNFLSIPGTHTMIGLPAGFTSGTYQIVLDGTNIAASSAAVINYLSSSGVMVALVSTPTVAVGSPVNFGALLADNGTPLVGATTTVTIVPQINISSQASVSGYTLVSSSAVDANTTATAYTATLTNNGPQLVQSSVRLDPDSLPVGVDVNTMTVGFGSVAANSTSASLQPFTVTYPSSLQFDPSSLAWRVMTAGTPAQITLLDSGPNDVKTGDGIYSGSFVPTTPGSYSALLKATGTSSAGIPFSRTAASDFVVTAPLASFTSIQSAFVIGATSLVEQLNVNANVNVSTPGSYSFYITLQASNGSVLQATSSSQLTAGSQTMTATFRAQSLHGLGVSGPYQLINATLFYVDSFDLTLAASMSQAGSTPTVALSSLDQGPLYFTGQNSASGVANSGAGTFDTLKVLIGVSTPGGGCSWSGDLEDTNGNIIDVEASSSQATAPLPVGLGSTELDFDGTKIARASVNGPLVVSRIGVHCSGNDIYANHFFTTQAFASSQFTGYSTSPVSLSAAATSVLTGASTSVQLTYLGPVSGSSITLSVAGLPTGVTAQFDFRSYR